MPRMPTPPGGFQSTLPVWGGTAEEMVSIKDIAFQSTLPVWGGTKITISNSFSQRISIHPPRVGRDLETDKLPSSSSNFNPPSPCGEGQVRIGQIT